MIYLIYLSKRKEKDLQLMQKQVTAISIKLEVDELSELEKKCDEYKLEKIKNFKNKHLKKGGYDAVVESASIDIKLKRASGVTPKK